MTWLTSRVGRLLSRREAPAGLFYALPIKENPMPIHIPAEATCDHCGKTAPCRLDCAFGVRTHAWDRREFEYVAAVVRGLDTWVWKQDGVACSDACKEALAKDPRYAGYSGRWTSFG
jgi:hypothetical protein